VSFTLSPDDKLLKPYLDSTFKAIFTSATEESNAAFCDFLTAAIGKEVREVAILQNEPPVKSGEEKPIRYDISCTFNNGEQANVEVQVQPVTELPKRLEYYAAKLLLTQDMRGLKYEKLMRTYQISLIVTGEVFKDEYAVHNFMMYDSERQVSLGGDVKIITVEASKVKEEDAIKLKSGLEQWAAWFKCAADPAKRELVNKLIESREGIQMATKTLVTFSMDGAARRKAELEEKIILDYQNDMYASEQKGKQEGIELGQKDLVRNLLRVGTDINQIAQATGWTVDQIKELQQEQ
jgi:predicted transposase/invertase (TIGR01784 family)